jgi:hypothetical protein
MLCSKCSFRCFSCSVENVCLACSDPVRSNLPVCSCPNGYFEILNQPLCVKCDPKCSSCFDLNSCEVCKQNSYRNNSNICKCDTGYYEPLNSLNPDCLKCDPKCISCENTPTNCTLCAPILEGDFCECNSNICRGCLNIPLPIPDCIFSCEMDQTNPVCQKFTLDSITLNH